MNDLLDSIEVDPTMVVTHTARQFLDFLALRGRATIKEFSHF